jgi:8-oxo-dGTP diphosphatase
MKTAVLDLITRARKGVNELLLAYKKTGEIGIGKVSAPGGKVEPGETPRHACAREVYEEFRISIPNNSTDLLEVAMLDVFTATGDGPYEHFMRVAVYQGDAYSGEPSETKDMHRPFWSPFSEIPYDDMYAGDDMWMPYVLEGNSPRLHFSVYRRDGICEKMESRPLEPFSKLMAT